MNLPQTEEESLVPDDGALVELRTIRADFRGNLQVVGEDCSRSSHG